MANPDHARPEEVAAIAAGWDDDQLECRLDRHDFRPLDAHFDDADGTFTRVRRCHRCYTDEHLIRSQRTGAKVRRWLDYSNTKDGYLFPAGTGRATTSSNDVMWLELFNRMQAQAAKKAAAKKTAGRKTPAKKAGSRKRRAA